MFEFSLTYGQIKVISSVLSNLAAAWLASIVVLPGLFGVKSVVDFLLLLTYSIPSATVAMYLASKLEDLLS